MAVKVTKDQLFIKLGKKKAQLPSDTPEQGDFCSMEIIGPDLENLNLDMKGFPNLERFSLVGGKGIIPDNFWGGVKLKSLKITKGSWQIPLNPGLDLNSLEKLNLGGMGLIEVPQWISLCPNLKELDLSNNNLTDLPLAFSQLVQLKRLNLDFNKMEKVPVALTRMPQLIHLSVDRNPFDAEEVELLKNIFGIWW